MSALPSPAESRARSPMPAGAVTPAMEPSENPHIAEIDVESVLFDVSLERISSLIIELTGEILDGRYSDQLLACCRQGMELVRSDLRS
jgi:hypothetical protein